METLCVFFDLAQESLNGGSFYPCPFKGLYEDIKSSLVKSATDHLSTKN
jgi:hypothetical protein